MPPTSHEGSGALARRRAPQDRRLDVDPEMPDGRKPKTNVVVAMTRAGRVQRVEAALAAGFDPNETETQGGKGCGSLRTCMHYAAMTSNVRMMGVLLRYGADVNARDKWGNTPLHYCQVSDILGESVDFLLDRGADDLVTNVIGMRARDKRIGVNPRTFEPFTEEELKRQREQEEEGGAYGRGSAGWKTSRSSRPGTSGTAKTAATGGGY